MKSIALLIVCFLLGFGIATAQDSSAVKTPKPYRIVQDSSATDSVLLTVFVHDKNGKQVPHAIVKFYSNSVIIGNALTDSNGVFQVKLFYSERNSICFNANAPEIGVSSLQPIYFNLNKKIKITLSDQIESYILRYATLPPNAAFNIPPGQFEIDQEMIQHSAYR